MNISEKFNELKRIEQQNNEIARQQKVGNLANKIMLSLSDSDTITSIENYLIENGSVSIKDFGCLCQGGFCSWQEGLNVLLQPLIKEWDLKGVIVRPSLRLDFNVKSAGYLPYTEEMTIEEIKEWMESFKKLKQK